MHGHIIGSVFSSLFFFFFFFCFVKSFFFYRSGEGGGRVMGWCWVNFQCRGVLLTSIIVGQGLTALTVGAGEGCLDIFSLVYHFSSFSLSLGDGPM